MKALLVAMNAKYIHSNLGVYCIRSYAKAHGVREEELGLAEYTINQNMEEVLADIYHQSPDLIAFSCYIWNIKQITTLAVELHKLFPKAPIWLGGPEVSFDAPARLKNTNWLTGIMLGEGEATFLDLLEQYKKGNPALEEVEGIAFKSRDNEVIVTPERPKLSMDDIPFCYKDMSGLKNRIVYYETSRGCPFGCSYCLSSVEKQVRFRSMDLVEKELQFFLDQKVPQVKFVDRTFNCQPKHTMAIWKYIYEHDNGITNFHFELSADLLTDEEIEYVKQFRPGLAQFEIGVQTTNPDTIKAIYRKTNLFELKRKVAKVHEARNIHQHLDLIAGLPYEDYASFRNSFNEVYAMEPDQFQLGFLKVLMGSPMHNQKDKYGIVYEDIPPYEVLFTDWLPYSDVLRLKQVEDMVERYYNSMQFECTIRYCVSQFSTPFDFYQELGEYYENQGFVGFHQSRLQNYEILLAFCECRPEFDNRLLKQMLLFDLYARENLKARPEFLTDKVSEEQKSYNRDFYQSEDKIQEYLPRYKEYNWKQIARMTHIEPFDFDVLRFVKSGEVVKRGCYVLFDYEERNPLDHQARMMKI